MSIIVNGTEIPQEDGKVIVNGVSVSKVIANGVTVWEAGVGGIDPVPPGKVGNLTASNDNVGSVELSWSPAANTEYYIIVVDGIALEATYDTFYTHTVAKGTYEYNIISYNQYGWQMSDMAEGISCELCSNSITDFDASDGGIGGVTMTFTSAGGYPEAIHDLYDADSNIKLASDISSGYLYDSGGTGSVNYKLKFRHPTISTCSGESNVDGGHQDPGYSAPYFPNDTFTCGADNGGFTVTFTPASGNPSPSHYLYNADGTLVSATPIQSGYYFNAPGYGEYPMYLEAVNSEGTATSRTDTGTSYSIVSAINDFAILGVDSNTTEISFTPNSGDQFPTHKYYLHRVLPDQADIGEVNPGDTFDDLPEGTYRLSINNTYSQEYSNDDSFTYLPALEVRSIVFDNPRNSFERLKLTITIHNENSNATDVTLFRDTNQENSWSDLIPDANGIITINYEWSGYIQPSIEFDYKVTADDGVNSDELIVTHGFVGWFTSEFQLSTGNIDYSTKEVKIDITSPSYNTNLDSSEVILYRKKSSEPETSYTELGNWELNDVPNTYTDTLPDYDDYDYKIHAVAYDVLRPTSPSDSSTDIITGISAKEPFTFL